MAASYRIRCINSTDKAYFFGVYQDFPKSPGMRSVAWQVRAVPPMGLVPVPPISDVDWTMIYGVSIAKWDKNGQRYTEAQIVSTELGSTYKVDIVDTGIPTIDPIPTGDTLEGQISFTNNTNMPLDMGFTLGGHLIAVQNVGGGETINFDVHPTYYVACYRSIQRGQLVESGIQIGPVTVTYEHEYTKCEVEADGQAGRYVLKNPKFVPTFKAFVHPKLYAAAAASVTAVAQRDISSQSVMSDLEMPGRGEVYVLQEGNGSRGRTGYYKLGISGDPSKRKSDLQTGNPRPLALKQTWPVIDMTTAEQAAKIAVAGYAARLGGGTEWYLVADDQLSTFLGAIENAVARR